LNFEATFIAHLGAIAAFLSSPAIMPSDTGETNDELSNDYVAEVLTKEARDSSVKYSAQGLGAYLPRRYDT
jgi:hypothetical protein